MKRPNFEFAVTAPLHELESWLPLWEATEPATLEIQYMRGRRDYLSGRTEELRQRIESMPNHSPAWLIRLLEFRLYARLRTTHPEEAAALADLAQAPSQNWPAEIHMVLGMYLEDHSRFLEARERYLLSARAFHAIELSEKGLTAEYNALIALTLAEPHRRYLVSYQAFILRAKSLGYPIIAGTALACFAREYQTLGLNELALEKSNEGLALLKEFSFGTIHYYLAVAQTLDLILKTGGRSAARPLYEELLASPFKEVEAIVAVLKAFEGDASITNLDALPQPWQERLKEPVIAGKSELDGRLVDHLTEGPKSLSELSQLLYGNKIDYESSLARTKQAVYRLRKKVPGLIGIKEGRYALVD